MCVGQCIALVLHLSQFGATWEAQERELVLCLNR